MEARCESANPCEPYLRLPEHIGEIDKYSGAIQAGNGKYPVTFAIAILSVADHVASYPVMFQKEPLVRISRFGSSPRCRRSQAQREYGLNRRSHPSPPSPSFSQPTLGVGPGRSLVRLDRACRVCAGRGLVARKPDAARAPAERFGAGIFPGEARKPQVVAARAGSFPR